MNHPKICSGSKAVLDEGVMEGMMKEEEEMQRLKDEYMDDMEKMDEKTGLPWLNYALTTKPLIL